MELDALRYPPTICAYEMDCGIVRQEINGMIYIAATDWHRTNAIMDYERRSRRAAEARADGATKEYG